VTRGWGAPAPDGIRHVVRAPHHPARAMPCPHCGAHEHQPCTTVSRRHRKTEPCPSRITTWVTAVAACPTRRAGPGEPCHHDDTHRRTAAATRPAGRRLKGTAA